MTAALDLCTLAWSDQQGYVFLSVRDTTKDKKQSGYWRDLSFRWPDDRTKIEDTIAKAANSKKDLYWSPNVFSTRYRDREKVKDIGVLYADLDETDPRKLPKNLKPAAAWETSPGRWQALWKLDQRLDRDTQTKLNQRLTYAIGADKGGWDLTQVLRTPGTRNHKYPGNPPVKMLWINGHSLRTATIVDDLPELDAVDVDRSVVQEVPSQSFVLSRRRVGAKATKLIRARHASGDRSSTLWELECLLAEKGLSPEEIVGVVRPTVWNKFADRRDELRQLSVEARKAIEHAGSITARNGDRGDTVEVVEQTADPLSWSAFDREHLPVKWMVAELWGESEVGFISGHPKSYKSWLALDLAVSVATGTRFLGTFACKKHNVLLIQEEDPRPIMQERLAMIGAAKGLLGTEIHDDGTFSMWYDIPDSLNIISNQGFTINEDWLESLEGWIKDRDIRLVILDPLMMMGEDVDEFKAFEMMNGILKPLKRLRAKTQTAIVVVHHHTKGAGQGGARDMYGSVALWAWEEAALHLNVVGVGKVVAERFSKHSLLPPVNIDVGDLADKWRPQVSKIGSQGIYDVLATMEAGATVDELVAYTSMGREAVDRQLKQLESDEKVERSGKRRTGQGRPSVVWRAKS